MKQFKYINLFSGIGGWELGLAGLPMTNVLSCEIDRHARATFIANFPQLPCIKNNNYPYDIRDIDPDNMPDFDILVGSPPCQSFSTAGLRRGFNDTKDDKGNMFFYTFNIIRKKRPRAFILENVKGLLNCDRGECFKKIQDMARDAGYNFYWRVIKGSDCGIPQIRQRVFMVGVRHDLCPEYGFEFPAPVPLKFTLRDVFKCNTCNRDVAHTIMTMRYNKRYGEKFNFSTYLVDGIERTITVNETKLIMGFPENFNMPVSEPQQRKQLGNGIIPDCVRMVATHVLDYLNLAV